MSIEFNKHAGINSRRKNTYDRKPEHYCNNCKCHRYSPCGCQTKQVKEKKK